jgi:hypothetical protein
MESDNSKPVEYAQIHTGFQICSELKKNEKCFRLQKYNNGEFEELFHEHVPKHRISKGNSIELLKALIVKYSGLEFPQIICSYLNNRNDKPSAIKLFQIQSEYPEPGVLRTYCSSGDLNIWFDEVIAPDKFRCSDISSNRNEKQII